MFSRLHTFIGGTHIDAAKNLTAELPIEAIPAPEKVVLPLSMHIGAPAKPLVQPGEKVYLGQKIAEAQGAVSSNIHASVSGMVVGSERRFLPNGTVAACMVIKNDGQDTLDPTITPRESGLGLPPDEIRQLLAEKGIVGMGGATFPTHVKYAPQSSGRIIDTVILNGIECEPFITADYRILLEHADEVIRGLKYFLKASLANKGIIAIEDNKPRAIELFNQLTADDPNISVVVCPEKYPQGSERHLIYAVTGRVVPERALPSAVGVIVDNVATAMQAALAVKDDLPCYERIVTVSGNAVHKPGNYRVRIGTLYSHLVEQGAQGLKNDPARIISGGPMMGFSLHSLDFPVLKGTGGLLLFDHQSELAKLPPENPCVRCGKCVDTCPMFLEPTQLFKAVKHRDWPAALAGHVGTCIECGSCAYNCPAHIPLVQYIRMGKQFILTDGFGGHNPYYKK